MRVPQNYYERESTIKEESVCIFSQDLFRLSSEDAAILFWWSESTGIGGANPDFYGNYDPKIDFFRNVQEIASGHQNWIQNRTEDKKIP